MILWNWFARKPKDPVNTKPKSESKYYGCDIEHLPIVGRYFPRYNGKYLYQWFTTGAYTQESSIHGCNYGKSKEDAIKILDAFLEQRGKGSVVITVEGDREL